MAQISARTTVAMVRGEIFRRTPPRQCEVRDQCLATARIHLGVVRLVLSLVLVACAEDPPPRAWTLIYYLPYDNDLGEHADPILEQLGEGASRDVAILALVDRPGPGGVERVMFTPERSVRHVELEGSGHPRVLGRLLDRAVSDLPAEHYALFVLDHGGKLDEIGRDDHGGPRWLSARGAQREIARWRREHRTKLDLLVLQQCGRGTIETYHLFREEADVVLASQGSIGAPNDYYRDMLASMLETHDGEDLARSVIDAEPPEMFVEYTAVHGESLDDLPAQLDAAIAPLLDVSPNDRGRTAAAGALTLRWADEQYADVLLFLRALYRAHDLDDAPLDALSTYIAGLVAHRRTSPSSPQASVLSGLSVLVPADARVIDRYARTPLYRASRIDELLRRHPQEIAPEVIALPGSTITASP